MALQPPCRDVPVRLSHSVFEVRLSQAYLALAEGGLLAAVRFDSVIKGDIERVTDEKAEASKVHGCVCTAVFVQLLLFFFVDN